MTGRSAVSLHNEQFALGLDAEVVKANSAFERIWDSSGGATDPKLDAS
jgi:hypothetical protein